MIGRNPFLFSDSLSWRVWDDMKRDQLLPDLPDADRQRLIEYIVEEPHEARIHEPKAPFLHVVPTPDTPNPYADV